MKHFEQAYLSKNGSPDVQVDVEAAPGGEIHCSNPLEDGQYYLHLDTGEQFDVEVRNQRWLYAEMEK